MIPDTSDVLRPYLPADELLWSAWLGLLSYALRQPDMVAAFRQETGNAWTPPRSGLERLIDEATGAEQAFVAAFAAWVNAELWGGEENIA